MITHRFHLAHRPIFCHSQSQNSPRGTEAKPLPPKTRAKDTAGTVAFIPVNKRTICVRSCVPPRAFDNEAVKAGRLRLEDLLRQIARKPRHEHFIRRLRPVRHARTLPMPRRELLARSTARQSIPIRKCRGSVRSLGLLHRTSKVFIKPAPVGDYRL